MEITKIVDKVLLIIIAIICIGISILDFSGLLDSVVWLRDRIPIILLLSFGLIALLLITEKSLIQNNLNEIRYEISKGNNQLLAYFKNETPDNQMIKVLNELWENREDLIHRLLNEAKQKNENINLLKEYISRMKDEFEEGCPFQAKLVYPPDFTLTIINISDGKLIYHPSIKQTNKIKSRSMPYSLILTKRNGEFIWFNTYSSENFIEAFGDKNKYKIDKSFNNRFTKVYFVEIVKLGVIVTFESHINLIHKLPMREKKKNDA